MTSTISEQSPLQLVVCGTDTDVGKTVVSALLVQGLGASYWKPVQSGLSEGSDRQQVIKLLNLPKQRWIPEAYVFQAPVSPHWAAERESKRINPAQLVLPEFLQQFLRFQNQRHLRSHLIGQVLFVLKFNFKDFYPQKGNDHDSHAN